jgi:hypothetical protein
MTYENYMHDDRRLSDAERLRLEVERDPKLREYMIAKGLGDPLEEPGTSYETGEIAIVEQDVAYLESKGISKAE